MITISETAQRLLQELAGQTGQSPTEVLEQALDQYRRHVFFEGLAADYAALRADSEAWAEEREERNLWDTTLMDGLDAEERWTEDGRCLNPGPPTEETA
jgi:hypothetical protein